MTNTTATEAEAAGTRRAGAARLVIADDHELARAGLRSMIGGEAGLEIVGEATNGREALELCRRHEPDLALLDMRMPEMDGLAATRAIKQELPDIRVIIVTMHENTDYLFEALRSGAAGYVLKDATRHEVVTAVQRVLRGESLLNPEVATRLLQRLVDEKTHQDGPPPVQLTPRELEVLRLLAQGQTNRQIAGQLIISAGTAKLYVERILAKLGVGDRTQAAVRAMELGLLTPHPE